MFTVSLLLREVIVVMRENNRVTSQHNTTRMKIPQHVPNGVRVDRRKEGRKAQCIDSFLSLLPRRTMIMMTAVAVGGSACHPSVPRVVGAGVN